MKAKEKEANQQSTAPGQGLVSGRVLGINEAICNNLHFRTVLMTAAAVHYIAHVAQEGAQNHRTV